MVLSVKICHITSVHPPDDVRIFTKECDSSVKQGFTTIELNGTINGIQNKNDVQIIGLKTSSNRILNTIQFCIKVLLLVPRLKIDICQIHDPELLILGYLIKKTMKLKIIYDIHEDYPRQLLSKRYLPESTKRIVSFLVEHFENAISKSFDYLITVTPFIKSRFAKISKTPIEIIANYPKKKEFDFDQMNSSKEINRFCYVGGLWKERGIFELIELFKRLPQCELVLAGKFNTKDEWIKFEIAKYKNIKYLGFLSRLEIPKLLQSSIAGLVMLHPIRNYRESFPIKMFEYMAAGIPVIASNFPLWQKIIDKYNCGICCNPFDIDQITSSIKYIIENPQIALEMGSNGRRAVETELNWENEEIKLISIYNKLLNNYEKAK